jgi:hypothetical protein
MVLHRPSEPAALIGKVKMLVILPGIDHRLRDRPASSLRSALLGGLDQRISEERPVGIPIVCRSRTAPSTFAYGGRADAIRDHAVGSLGRPLLSHQTTL